LLDVGRFHSTLKDNGLPSAAAFTSPQAVCDYSEMHCGAWGCSGFASFTWAMDIKRADFFPLGKML